MTETKKIDKTADHNVAPGAVPGQQNEGVSPQKVIEEKALSDMVTADFAAPGKELADKAGVTVETNAKLAEALGVKPYDPDVQQPRVTRDTSFAQAVATRPGAAAASQAPDGPDPEPILRDPSIKSFTQVRLDRELSGENAAISGQAYPDGVDRTTLNPSPKARKEMDRGAELVKERESNQKQPARKSKAA